MSSNRIVRIPMAVFGLLFASAAIAADTAPPVISAAQAAASMTLVGSQLQTQDPDAQTNPPGHEPQQETVTQRPKRRRELMQELRSIGLPAAGFAR